MKTSEIAIQMKGYISKLIGLFLDRNLQYASEEEWDSNFRRNAALNKIYRMQEIIEEPYGVSIEYVLQKLDRLVNGIILATGKYHRGWLGPSPKYSRSISDSIDDAIVYLFITKQILIEEGLIEEVPTNVVIVCSKCKASITPDNIIYQDNPVLCKKCFKEKDGL